MFLITLNTIEIIIAMFLVFLVFLLALCLLRAALIRNKEIRILQLDEHSDQQHDYYINKLKGLIEIKTSSFEDPEFFLLFQEKIKSDFPFIHECFNKEKVGRNAVFTSKVKIEGAPNILFAAHVDYTSNLQEVKIEDGELYGNGTFDSKSLFFSMFEAVEKILTEQSRLDVNLTMVMTTDDETTQDGMNHIVDQFLKSGKFFDLAIEEGSGIVDPAYFGLMSHYALIGIGLTGETTVRFKTVKSENGEKNLSAFLEELQKNPVFKPKIDQKAMIPLREMAKDLPFFERFFFNNLFIFRPFVKRKIDEEYLGLSKLLKTQIIMGEVECTEEECRADLTFELATHNTTADIILALSKSLRKYGVEYQLLNNVEATKIADIHSEGFKVVEKTIRSVYKNIYTAPVIVTNISEKRYFDKVSDCVIRFSPLYYTTAAYREGKKGLEHVSGKSLCYAVSFFQGILKTYTRR